MFMFLFAFLLGVLALAAHLPFAPPFFLRLGFFCFFSRAPSPRTDLGPRPRESGVGGLEKLLVGSGFKLRASRAPPAHLADYGSSLLRTPDHFCCPPLDLPPPPLPL